MIRIGLLSDTHSYIDDGMLKFLDKVDEIWHAGDIGSFEVIDQLKVIANIRAVYGNIDGALLRQEYKRDELFKVENTNVVMTHIGGYPNRYAPGFEKKIVENNAGIFISGHSHILKVIFDKKFNCLHLNPGAAGIYGFHKVRTMMRFSIDGTEIKDLEIWEHLR